ncbi:MAG TPA: DUF6338 family protein [Candidatus Acidoferrales bacterium]|nr:DUF6338 family protein [Candidatus Acidoferrales bacterium]
MSPLGFGTLAALFILLPGFITASILRTLCVRPAQSEFDKLIQALMYSFVVYVLFVSIVQRLPLEAIQRVQQADNVYYLPAVRYTDLVLLFGFAAALGLLLSIFITNDIHGKFFRRLSMSNRSSRPSIWQDVFSEVNEYVQVQFQDGRSLLGWPRYFSDSPDESSLFLENAAWIGEDGSIVDVPGAGVLITKEIVIETIMFLKGNPRSGGPSEKVGNSQPAAG